MIGAHSAAEGVAQPQQKGLPSAMPTQQSTVVCSRGVAQYSATTASRRVAQPTQQMAEVGSNPKEG